MTPLQLQVHTPYYGPCSSSQAKSLRSELLLPQYIEYELTTIYLLGRQGCVALHLPSHQQYIHSYPLKYLRGNVKRNQLHQCHPRAHTPRYKFPSLPYQTLTALIPHLSVIPGSLVLRGPQACQTSSSPSKKYPSSRHNPPIPPLPHPHPSQARQTKIKSH